ncbi:MAPEG family protein [Alteromonas sp. a30]|uniref:MAPEG family protein n=1 Tax=Alteromonas sp. a30 TaxID=2730917 RepID=UPI00227E4BBA|nr:MAPEG family protein [Alteromonas sp. a30]MCY7296897.1 MAPEG family protein [Alteromonas sp. a30]
MQSTHLIQPVVILVLWSMIMWLWMYATRLPAMKAAKIKPDSNAPQGHQMSQLPAHVRWKADNYNHLMEQPTLFYAVMMSLALMGTQSTVVVYTAWAYVALRIIHSLIQALGNKIIFRFTAFFLSNIALFILTVNAVMHAF